MQAPLPIAIVDPALPNIAVDRDALVVEHIPQIKRLAYQLRNKLPACIEARDLIAEGILGLLDAIDKFNPARGVKFKTFAEYRIRGAMIDSLRRQDWVPRSLRKESRQIGAMRQELESRLGRPPREEEMAEMTGLSMEKYRAITDKMAGMGLASLSDETLPGNKDGEQKPAEQSQAKASDPFADLLKAEICNHMAGVIDGLKNRERIVVSLYYYDGLTMREIGIILGVNESRVSQIHTRAIMRLRTRLKELHNHRLDV
jgi:RNA polymerase sigma factor FliA